MRRNYFNMAITVMNTLAKLGKSSKISLFVHVLKNSKIELHFLEILANSKFMVHVIIILGVIYFYVYLPII